jgi:hypothetical protein
MTVRMAECHPERRHHGRGLCQPCIKNEWRARHPEKVIAERARRKGQQRVYDRKAKAKQRAADPKRYNAMRTAYRYRMSLDEYLAFIARPCAACGAPARDIDHDHRTGAVRDPLCGGCNRALGAIDDDPIRLLALVEYLAKHGITAKELVG